MPSMSRDSNHQVVQGNESFKVAKTITFDGTAGNGAVGTVSIFTVTGDVLCKLYGVVGTTLEGATATIAIGVSGNTTALITTTTATDLVANRSWADASPIPSEQPANDSPDVIGGGLDIFATVATANITAGVLKLYCVWRPLSNDGKVEAS